MTSAAPEGSERTLKALRQLLSAQRFGEAEVRRSVASLLDEAGCEVVERSYSPRDLDGEAEFASESVCPEEERRFVLGRLPGSADRRSLLLFAHPDCEPVDGVERWSCDPFAGEAVEGRIAGWGVADDLAGCAAGIATLAELARRPGTRGEVAFLAAPSKGYARGAAAWFRSGARHDAALYLHPAESGLGLREIKTVTPGQLEFRILVHGAPPETTEPAHSALSHRSHNPVDGAVEIVGALRGLGERRALDIRHQGIEAVAGRATNLHVSQLFCGQGEPLSRISDRCRIGGAVCFPPGEAPSEVRQQLELAVRARCEASGWPYPVHVEWVSGTPPAEIPCDHPFLQLTERAVRSVSGVRTMPNVTHVASDIRHPMAISGTPCVGLGCLCGNLVQNGATDEWVEIRSLGEMASVACRVAEEWTCRARHAGS